MEEDDFFGDNDSDEGGCGLAEHEAKATEVQYQNVGYLEAYDEHKEAHLQDGFEAGYRDVYDIALRLGRLLGQRAAQIKLKSMLDSNHNNNTEESQDEISTLSRQYREIMDQINRQGDTSDVDTKKMLVELEGKVRRLLDESTT